MFAVSEHTASAGTWWPQHRRGDLRVDHPKVNRLEGSRKAVTCTSARRRVTIWSFFSRTPVEGACEERLPEQQTGPSRMSEKGP